MKRLRSEAGVTLVEIMFGALALSVAALAVISSQFWMQKNTKRQQILATRDRIVASLAEEIRTNIDKFQLDYNELDPNDLFDDLPVDRLPWAWNEQTWLSLENGTCPPLNQCLQGAR